MLIIGSVPSLSQPFGPDDVKGYTDEVRQAMKLLEPLLQSGYMALHPDRWRQGKLSFMPPRFAKRSGWVPPVVPESEPAAAACSCACCPKVRG